MTKEIYDFDYDMGEASCRFEVNRDVFTVEMANATLGFFTWDYDDEADPIDEVVKKYAQQAIWYATKNDHNENGVIKDFEGGEGYARVDGSMGIKLISVSGYEFDWSRLEMEKKDSE